MREEILFSPAALFAGFLLDCIFGDPHGMPHPVRAIGALIRTLEIRLRALFPETPAGERTAGVFLVVITTLMTGAAAFLFLFIPAKAAGIFGRSAQMTARFLTESISIYYMLAIRSLRDESDLVRKALLLGDTEGARKAVSMIVGRDTDRLDEEQIAKAAVETVAEGTSDGVVSPLFWYMFFGPVGGWVYKAVNTMDSMVGYRNERYLHFGRAAARTDDFANYLSSRLAALLMIAAAFLTGEDGKDAFRIWRRDRRNHKSPNSAQTESACAGALGIRLAGDAWYFGKKVEKPYIGDPKRRCEPDDIRRAGRLMTVSSVLMLILAAVVRSLLSALTA